MTETEFELLRRATGKLSYSDLDTTGLRRSYARRATNANLPLLRIDKDVRSAEAREYDYAV